MVFQDLKTVCAAPFTIYVIDGVDIFLPFFCRPSKTVPDWSPISDNTMSNISESKSRCVQSVPLCYPPFGKPGPDFTCKP